MKKNTSHWKKISLWTNKSYILSKNLHFAVLLQFFFTDWSSSIIKAPKEILQSYGSNIPQLSPLLFLWLQILGKKGKQKKSFSKLLFESSKMSISKLLEYYTKCTFVFKFFYETNNLLTGRLLNTCIKILNVSKCFRFLKLFKLLLEGKP